MWLQYKRRFLTKLVITAMPIEGPHAILLEVYYNNYFPRSYAYVGSGIMYMTETKPVVIYKYLKKKHLKQFKEKGIAKIGNIEYYRAIENKKINDPHEGRTTYNIFTKEEAIELSVDQVNAINNTYYSIASLQIAPYSYFSSDLIVPNVFIFSASCRFDKKLMNVFGYDAYYKITDINQFMNTIHIELDKQFKLLFSVASKVRYVKTKIINVTNKNKNSVIRTSAYTKSISDKIKTIYIEDYFTKHEKFSEEDEFRLVYVPLAPISKKPVYLKCKKLINYCEF